MDQAETTIGGIILASTSLTADTGTIIQSGIDMAAEGLKVALDDKSASHIIINGQEYVSAQEKDIILITK